MGPSPTIDPAIALKGTLAPVGGPKGYGLALMVDLSCGALNGMTFGPHITPMYEALDTPQDLGHLLIAIDPGPLSGGSFAGRMRALVDAVAVEPGTRLPGERRVALRPPAARDGLDLADNLIGQL